MAFVYQRANGQRACPEQSRRVATRVDGTLYYVHQDHLGSTVAVSDAAGQPLSRSHYLPYGEVYKSECWDGNAWQEYDPATTPLPETDYLYTGHLLDRNTNLYYYGGGRYYDPYLGKYQSPDPFAGVPQVPQSLNRYSYLGNSPTGYEVAAEAILARQRSIEPDGLSLTTDFGRWFVEPANLGKNALDVSLTVTGHILEQRKLALYAVRSQRFFYQHVDEVALGAVIARRETRMIARPARLGLRVMAGQADELVETALLLEHASRSQVAAVWRVRTATRLARLSTVVDVGSALLSPVIAGALQYVCGRSS